MLRADKRVILYAVILSAILAIPALTMPLADHQARQKWEKRELEAFPDLTQALISPKQTFTQLDGFVDDHIGGGFQIIKARRKFYYNTFHATGDLYMVENAEGALFMTAPFDDATRDNPFSWWRRLCLEGQKPDTQKDWTERFIRSQKLLSKGGATVVYGMTPTKSVLMSADLPRSTPADIREGCSKISPQNNHGLKIEDLAPDVDIFYPLGTFQDRASDPLFYPNTAYHWQGESAWAYTEELANEYNLSASPMWPSGPCKAQPVNWDIGLLTGVGETTPGCDRNRSQLGIIVENNVLYPLRSGSDKSDVRVTKLTNPHATNTKTAIVFSNSFGPVVRELIASHFQTTYHLRTEIVSAADMQRLFYDSNILEADFIITTVADFHYPEFLDWLSPADSSKAMYSPEAIAEAETRDREIRARLKRRKDIADERLARIERRKREVAEQKAKVAAEKAKEKALRQEDRRAAREEKLAEIERRQKEAAERKAKWEAEVAARREQKNTIED